MKLLSILTLKQATQNESKNSIGCQIFLPFSYLQELNLENADMLVSLIVLKIYNNRFPIKQNQKLWSLLLSSTLTFLVAEFQNLFPKHAMKYKMKMLSKFYFLCLYFGLSSVYKNSKSCC